LLAICWPRKDTSEVLEYMVKMWGEEMVSLEGLLRFKVGGIGPERMNGDFGMSRGDNVWMVGWWGATPRCCRVMPEAHGFPMIEIAYDGRRVLVIKG